MIEIDHKYAPVLLEALEELMYKLSIRLDGLKGGPLDEERRDLTRKQAEVEALQHLIHSST